MQTSAQNLAVLFGVLLPIALHYAACSGLKLMSKSMNQMESPPVHQLYFQ
jgi:hypothetical protein